MSYCARFSLLLVIALLGACASAPPPPAPRVVQQAPISYPTEFAPAADDVLFRALGLVGTPYRWGGNTPDSGFDCSGLIGFVYRDAAHIALPRTTRDLVGMRAPQIDKAALQSGDLVFFATEGSQVSHAGIYVGEGRFVHAPATGGTVRLDYLNNPYWARTYRDAKRVLQPEHIARNP
jgi:cell wall-associated NlpC family hydrolase